MAVDQNKRLNTTVKIIGDYKKAKTLEKSRDKLFGERFIKVLID